MGGIDVKNINIGLIGYGFMGRTHSNAFRTGESFLRRALPAGAQDGLRPQRGARQAVRGAMGIKVPRSPTGANWWNRPPLT